MWLKKLNKKLTNKKKHEVHKVKLTPKLKKTRLLDCQINPGHPII